MILPSRRPSICSASRALSSRRKRLARTENGRLYSALRRGSRAVAHRRAALAPGPGRKRASLSTPPARILPQRRGRGARRARRRRNELTERSLDPLFTWVDHHRCHSGESDGQVPPLPRVVRGRTKRPECLQRWRSETSAKRTTEFDTAKTISVDEISDAPRSHFVALVRTVPAQHTCAHWARVRKQIALRAVRVCESVSRGR